MITISNPVFLKHLMVSTFGGVHKLTSKGWFGDAEIVKYSKYSKILKICFSDGESGAFQALLKISNRFKIRDFGDYY